MFKDEKKTQYSPLMTREEQVRATTSRARTHSGRVNPTASWLVVMEHPRDDARVRVWCRSCRRDRRVCVCVCVCDAVVVVVGDSGICRAPTPPTPTTRTNQSRTKDH